MCEVTTGQYNRARVNVGRLWSRYLVAVNCDNVTNGYVAAYA